MPQTLLALFAICIAATFAFQQQQAVLRSHLGMIANEVNTQAMGVSAEVLERIAVAAFDEATAGSAALVPAASLTAPDDFGPDPGDGGYDTYDDVDDFHGMNHTIVRPITNPTDGRLVDLEFEVSARVYYLEEDPVTGRTTESEEPTYRKHVELLVRCPSVKGVATPQLRMGRTYTYPN